MCVELLQSGGFVCQTISHIFTSRAFQPEALIEKISDNYKQRGKGKGKGDKEEI